MLAVSSRQLFWRHVPWEIVCLFTCEHVGCFITIGLEVRFKSSKLTWTLEPHQAPAVTQPLSLLSSSLPKSGFDGCQACDKNICLPDRHVQESAAAAASPWKLAYFWAWKEFPAPHFLTVNYFLCTQVLHCLPWPQVFLTAFRLPYNLRAIPLLHTPLRALLQLLYPCPSPLLIFMAPQKSSCTAVRKYVELQ